MKRQYAGEPGVAEDADERVCRRAELLPRQASVGEAARDHPLRAVDGVDLHRRQHRRRHREGIDPESQGLLRRARAELVASRSEAAAIYQEPSGSNGIAIAPSNTTASKSLLLINPHTSFFFRAEVQMTSEEGLNAYGAVTWGQFFVYQGFNDRAGWMHTTSNVDAVDEYLETVVQKGDRVFLSLRRATSVPMIDDEDHRAVQDRDGDGEKGVHRLSHAARADRAEDRRQVGRASG